MAKNTSAKIYRVITGDNDEEIMVLPSPMGNPSHYRRGVRIGATTVWLKREEAKELAELLVAEE